MSKNRSKKNKNTIPYKDGWIIYNIKITEERLICQCGGDELCNHIKNLLIDKNISNFVLCFYQKFKSIISQNYNDENLLDILDKECDNILSEDCGFCCSELRINPKKEMWVMCNNCNKLIHSKCYNRWTSKNKNCIYCRYEFPPNQPL